MRPTHLPDGGSDPHGLVLRNIRLDAQPHSLNVSVDVHERGYDENNVPLVEIILENLGDEPHQIAGSSSRIPPWPTTACTPNQLAIVPKSAVEQEVFDESGPPCITQPATTMDLKWYEIKPGEVVAEKHVILGVEDHIRGDYPDSGTYRTEAGLGVDGKWGFAFDLVPLSGNS